MFKMLRRSLSTLTASALVLGMLAFVPGAFAAAELDFSPTPADEFTIAPLSTYKVNATLSGYEEDKGVFLYISKKDENAFVAVDNYTYTGNQSHQFTWDGKINNANVTAGMYTLRLAGVGITPITKDFEVKVLGDIQNNGPKISFSPALADEYVLESGDYKIPVKLENYKALTTVKLEIGKKGANFMNTIDTHQYNANGTYEFTWDGKLQGVQVDLGEYNIKVSGQDTQNNILAELTDTVIVKELGPKLDFNPTPEKEYTLGGVSYKVSAALTNYKAPTFVKFGVREKGANNYYVVDEYDYQGNETRQFTWDGKLNGSLVKPGTYEFQLFGTDDNNTDTNILKDEVVVKEQVIVDDTLCAGYKDVNANSKYCDAVEWNKKAGIMTGEGNGEFFNGNGDLNRAAVSKIALQAYNEYNDNTDYCNGNKPFPDVALGEWYSNYICRAKAIKMVTGYEFGVDAGKFVPGRSVSVVEMFAILLRPLDKNFVAGPSYQGLDSKQWYAEYAKYAKDNALYPGNVLSPTQEATRYEVAQFLYELYLKGELES